MLQYTLGIVLSLELDKPFPILFTVHPDSPGDELSSFEELGNMTPVNAEFIQSSTPALPKEVALPPIAY